MANPDDRSDNVEKLQEMIQNTMQNVREAEDYLRAHSSEMSKADAADIRAKNERREDSIQHFRDEIHDEVEDMQ